MKQNTSPMLRAFKSSITKWIVLCFLCYSLTGCLETEITLTGDDYKLIDSLYTKQKDSLMPLLDKACVQFQDSVMQLWIDSIMEKRQNEIEKLIGR